MQVKVSNAKFKGDVHAISSPLSQSSRFITNSKYVAHQLDNRCIRGFV